ncbi:MAG: ABC transporter permease [Clostridiales bacterium]|nr:ABC transporter permease [Clostridiales bacterium]
MTLTKHRLALLTIAMTVIYFALFMFLPESVVGNRAESLLLYISKVMFLGMGASVTTASTLILIYKKEFIKWQMESFRRFKYLLRLLVKRDFVSRYRKSMLGVLWSLLNPLLTMLVITMVFSYIFNRAIDNFPVYLLSGQLIFHFYTESTTRAMNSVIGHQAIIRKVYIPKYIFPLSSVLSSLVNVLFSLIAFVLVFIVTRAPFHWTILLVPIPMLYTFVFSLGVAMILSSLAVFFRDLTYLYGIFTTLLMYLTPLFYPAEILPRRVLTLIGLNPMYHFVDYFRSLALRGVVPGLWANMVCFAFSMAALCCGVYVFMANQDRYYLYF